MSESKIGGIMAKLNAVTINLWRMSIMLVVEVFRIRDLITNKATEVPMGMVQLATLIILCSSTRFRIVSASQGTMILLLTKPPTPRPPTPKS